MIYRWGFQGSALLQSQQAPPAYLCRWQRQNGRGSATRVQILSWIYYSVISLTWDIYCYQCSALVAWTTELPASIKAIYTKAPLMDAGSKSSTAETWASHQERISQLRRKGGKSMRQADRVHEAMKRAAPCMGPCTKVSIHLTVWCSVQGALRYSILRVAGMGLVVRGTAVEWPYSYAICIGKYHASSESYVSFVEETTRFRAISNQQHVWIHKWRFV